MLNDDKEFRKANYFWVKHNLDSVSIAQLSRDNPEYNYEKVRRMINEFERRLRNLRIRRA